MKLPPPPLPQLTPPQSTESASPAEYEMSRASSNIIKANSTGG
eukprot:CAMPEP_0197848752 /NCGR_PEP_ID=MMETSP1438-20131217/9917_1 /TAXON_ID=1461541 /ORGANISM="Pterosperma sp., Strain CCMP1384" /LENGTH=42 /DNA_ID= /DNA_START= /DNA_END= /DNA_ORIENTATION=